MVELVSENRQKSWFSQKIFNPQIQVVRNVNIFPTSGAIFARLSDKFGVNYTRKDIANRISNKLGVLLNESDLYNVNSEHLLQSRRLHLTTITFLWPEQRCQILCIFCYFRLPWDNRKVALARATLPIPLYFWQL